MRPGMIHLKSEYYYLLSGQEVKSLKKYTTKFYHWNECLCTSIWCKKYNKSNFMLSYIQD